MARGANFPSVCPIEIEMYAETAVAGGEEPRNKVAERNRSTFRQNDVTRALRGALKAGLDIGRIEIDPAGRIVLFAKSEACEPSSPLEEWKQNHARAS